MESTLTKLKRRFEKHRTAGSFLIMFLVIITITGFWYFLSSDSHPETLAPNFSLTDIDGIPFELDDFSDKLVIINFMTTWCGQCRLEIRNLELLSQRYGDSLVVILVNIDPLESEETLRAFAQEISVPTWIWAKDTANLAQAYQVTRFPKTVIISDRHIQFQHTDVTPASTLIQEIDKLLGYD